MVHNKKMVWIMVACCAIPVVAIVALSAAGVEIGGALRFLMFLACPALHLLMMLGMRSGHKRSEHSTEAPYRGPLHGEGHTDGTGAGAGDGRRGSTDPAASLGLR